jgi:hypothetical protein
VLRKKLRTPEGASSDALVLGRSRATTHPSRKRPLAWEATQRSGSSSDRRLKTPAKCSLCNSTARPHQRRAKPSWIDVGEASTEPVPGQSPSSRSRPTVRARQQAPTQKGRKGEKRQDGDSRGHVHAQRKAAACLHREGSDALRGWVRKHKDRLYAGNAETIVRSLRASACYATSEKTNELKGSAPY